MDIKLAKLNITKTPGKKNLKKKIKISTFTFVAIFIIVSIFAVFNFIVIPNLEKKYSSLYGNDTANIKVYEGENHFDIKNTQNQIANRKAFVATTIMPNPGDLVKSIPLN